MTIPDPVYEYPDARRNERTRSLVNSRDVAREAGVSQATVSRVLTSGAVVSDETRQRVLDAMQRVGYVPNMAAQALKTGRAGTVGIVVADLENPFYPQLLEALGKALDQAGLRITVWIAEGHKNNAALHAIQDGSVDGVIFTTVTEESGELRRALGRRSPIVLVNRTAPGIACDQVASDNHLGGTLVADFLVAHGRRNIAYIGGARRAPTARSRLAGFAGRLAEHGQPLAPEHIVPGELGHASGYRSMLTLLETQPGIDAVFCSEDVIAFGALDAARRRGVRVPDDLWVVGYDDIDMASWEAFDLTTVRQDIGALASHAAQMLLDRLDDPSRSAVTAQLTPRLIVRGSARPRLAGGDG